MKEEKWEKVYEGSGAHLERVKEMYEELGMEIRLEPVPVNECESCKRCYQAGKEQLYRLYVKKC